MLVEAHPFFFEKKPLYQFHVISAGAGTDHPFGVHYAMPGDRTMVSEGAQRVAHLPRMARYPRQARDLAVSRDASHGYA